MFIKTRTKHASKDGIELVVFKSFREVLIEALSFGFGLAVLVIDGFFLIHTMIYGTHKQTHNKEKEIKVLSLSSNRKQLMSKG